MLHTFPKTLVENIFCGNNISNLEKYGNKSKGNAYNVLLLYSAVKCIYYNEYNGPLPPKSLIDSCASIVQDFVTPKNYPLKGALEIGFGGQQYVLTKIFYQGIHIGRY